MDEQHRPKVLEGQTRWKSGVHTLKTMAFSARRLVRDALDTSVVRHEERSPSDSSVVAESRSRIWVHDEPGEWILEAGKVENLRCAARRLDGVFVPGGEIFSFWKHIGRPTRRRGFVEGREILQGCVVPTIGGGLCQLSNALYDASLDADFDIVERHRHSKIVPGSMAEDDRDATIFWPHVDLRFRSNAPFRLEVELTQTELVVRFLAPRASCKSTDAPYSGVASEPAGTDRRQQTARHNCLNCNQTECFRHGRHRPLARNDGARTGFLLDGFWPEFDRYVQSEADSGDLACVPLPRPVGDDRYPWSLAGIDEVRHTGLVTALRGLHSRTLRAQGAKRQRALLRWDRTVARVMADQLDRRTTRVVVSQNLLPFLWRDGRLQGRRFDVLMQRFPLSELHRRLDAAADLHPESPTLGDFRAPPQLLADETAALKAADRIATPHSAMAALFPHKSVELDWELPGPGDTNPSRLSDTVPTILFPASTVGRKGIFELRDALDALDREFELVVAGPNLEKPDFWSDRPVQYSESVGVERADVVVLPAHIEHQPRQLLRAAANGIPVVASRACGVGDVDGVTEVPTGDVPSLFHTLKELLS